MRVWDIPVHRLCNKHLIAQHHEIHCIYSIITNNLKGFAHHPETMRWRGHLSALEDKHDETADEMKLNRGLNHNDIIDTIDWDTARYNLDSARMPEPWQPVEEQMEILKLKGCDCKVI